MNLRFLADTGERVVRTFLQAYIAAWTVLGAEWDTLFTLNNLKVGVTAAVLALGTALVGKPVGNPDSASVLPPAAQPPAPQPPEQDPPAPEPAPGLTAEQQLAELLRQIQLAPPLPPAPTLAPPPIVQPRGVLLDPNLVGGRDPHSEGNT